MVSSQDGPGLHPLLGGIINSTVFNSQVKLSLWMTNYLVTCPQHLSIVYS